jgi:predicted dehydrogenase
MPSLAASVDDGRRPLGSVSSVSSPDPSVSPSAYTVGLMGAGGIAQVHLPAWLALGVTVLVTSEQGADELVRRHGGGTVVSSVDEVLGRCDAVDICTPTPTHAELGARAAAAGRAVFCEKPLARTADQAARLIAVCDEAGVQLYPGHVVRYFAEYATMQRAVAAGALGRVAVQRFSRTGSRPEVAWFADDVQSGGLVLDQMVHDLDFARWTAGEVAGVFAREVRPAGSSGVRTAQVVLTHVEGAISYVTGTWARRGTAFRTTFEVVGTDGLLAHDSRAHQPLRIDQGVAEEAGGPGTGLLPDTSGGESPYLTQIREVYRAFRGGPAPRVSADDGLQAIRIAEAATRSIQSGAPEELA